jgi:ABC-2 type transport system permease protein
MNATVARLTARSLLGRRRALVLLALPAVLLIMSVLTRSLAGPDDGITSLILKGFALGTVIPLFALIAGTGAIGPEIDDGSIVYLLSKPLSRPQIVRTKLAVAVATVLVVAVVPTLVAGLVLAGTADRAAVGYAVGVGVAGVTYCALFLLLAVVTRNAVVVGLGYALVWETLIGGYVPGAQALSVQQWSLAVTEWIIGSRASVGLRAESAVSLGTAVPLLLVVLVGCTWYAGRRLRSIRVTTDD